MRGHIVGSPLTGPVPRTGQAIISLESRRIIDMVGGLSVVGAVPVSEQRRDEMCRRLGARCVRSRYQDEMDGWMGWRMMGFKHLNGALNSRAKR